MTMTAIKYFLMTCSFLTTVPAAAATDVVAEKTVVFDKGQVLVTTRREEEKLGLPFTVELKVSCGGKTPNWKSLVISDSESVCDVKPQSAKLATDGKSISILIRETDSDAFNEKSQSADASELGELRPTCKKVGREFLFSLEKYCR